MPDPHPPRPAFPSLDHVAIAVRDTDEALALWRDTLGFPVVCSEVVNQGAVRLTHLDLGNVHLQLVQPLAPDHPLHAFLSSHGGAGLHHLCFRVDDVAAAQPHLPVPAAAPAPHQGTQGKRALFLDRRATAGVQLEITGH